ncbi:hypothetical protein D3C81_1414190 [compost metagenome]
MRHLLKISAWLSSIAFVGISIWLGKEVPFEKQWPLFEALRTTASIIFAVVGAWIAIVYPDRLKLSFSEGVAPTGGTQGGLSKLFSPVVHSTAILCIILIIGVVAPLIKTIPFALEHTESLRSLSYGALVSLTLWQLWTVVLTLVPADIIKTATDREDEHRGLVEGYGKQSSRE